MRKEPCDATLASMAAKKPRNYSVEDARIGHDDDNVEVQIIKTALGRAVIVPRSLSRLTGGALEAIADVQLVAAEIQAQGDQLEVFVREARDHGASWAAIGWSVGTSGEAARQRWGDDPRD